MATVHVIGAGLAGLACAVRLGDSGQQVCLYEAAGQAGGRCRSFFDATLERWIDNGNHLILGANTATFRYLDATGGRDSLLASPRAVFPFCDLGSGARWVARPNAGPIPWWTAVPSRRVPESRAWQYLAALWRVGTRPQATVADCFDRSEPIFHRFFEPLAVAVLNAKTEEGAARLLWPVLAAIFLGGARACRGYVAREGLSASLVDPAIARLERLGARIFFGHRLRALDVEGAGARALLFAQRTVSLAPRDRVVLAVPPQAAAALIPGLRAPQESRAILNVHFRLEREPRLPAGAPFLGLVGGTGHWLFVRKDVAAVTVSAADDLIDRPAETLAALLWADAARALGEDPGALPPHRIVKERRATFAQTPAALKLRPGPRTALENVFLAGDWTDTGLPATIEGAIRSGHRAARLATGWNREMASWMNGPILTKVRRLG
ncbi:MAG: hydroxysqualene dehydroxylase HpnE [Alphaproteobacteria bacterium]